MSGDPDAEAVDAFFRCMRGHGSGRKVSVAVDDLWRLMKEVEAALGHRITPR